MSGKHSSILSLRLRLLIIPLLRIFLDMKGFPLLCRHTKAPGTVSSSVHFNAAMNIEISDEASNWCCSYSGATQSRLCIISKLLTTAVAIKASEKCFIVSILNSLCQTERMFFKLILSIIVCLMVL